jgi:hypothetical protein
MASDDAASTSTLTDCLEIFYAPSAVFERRKAAPAFGVPLLILVVALLVLFFAFRGAMDPIFDAEFKRGFAAAMKKNPQITQDMAAQAAAVARKFTGVIVGGYFLFGPLLVGFVLWMVGKFVGAKEELGAACMVATFAFFPRIIEGIINPLQALLLPDESLTGRYSVSLGLGRFFNPDTANPLLLAVAGRVDLFTIWITILLAIGLSVTGKVSRSQAALAAAIVWVIGALPALWGAYRQM